MMLLTVIMLCFVSYVMPNYEENVINEFAVEMDMDALEANLDLSAYNLEVIRKVSSLGNVFHLKHNSQCSDHRCRRSASDSIAEILRKHPLIHRVEQQVALEVEIKSRLEYVYNDKDLDEEVQKKSFDELNNVGNQAFDTLMNLEKKDSEDADEEYPEPDKQTNDSIDYNNENKIEDTFSRAMVGTDFELSKDDKMYQKLVKERRQRVKRINFNDPEASHLWQYNNYGQFNHINPGMDMNLYQVYLSNITGKGVVATVIDDGLDTHHVDIADNYDPAASLDFNDPSNIDSSPRGPHEDQNVPSVDGHGTECAAVIGGVANNKFCAHGVAFNINLGGIRLLAKNIVTDLLEAFSLTHNNQYIDIYSNSWGPKDSGGHTAPVTHYVNKAFLAGVTGGRRGKGSIFLFAAGNGGMKHDHCGGDGLVNSPYTISVTATNIQGEKPAYTEECSAISITAAVGGYSYQDMFERDEIDPLLTAAEINGKCAKKFAGTSAATPLIAGCIALAFEANHELSWRDIQHLLALSARIPNSKETVWQLNTAGYLTSHVYGFGLLDCSGLVYNAFLWKSVGEKRSCIGGKTKGNDELIIRRKKRTRITFQTTACEQSNRSIDVLEHVLIYTKIQHPCRGDLAIMLLSPTGTRSILLKNRKMDRNNATISFSHLSLMNWGENPRGTWHLDIVDVGQCQSSLSSSSQSGKIIEASLEFFGTQRTDSAFYRNERLINDYFKEIKLEKPEQSIILNSKQLYDYFNEQRKYFIQIYPAKGKVNDNEEEIQRKETI